jgi:hypothetical protein
MTPRRVALAAVLLAACDASAPRTPATPAKPAEARPAAPKPVEPVFTDVAAEAGLVAENHTGARGKKTWIASAMGGGAIVLDYDQDGRMDLVVVDGTGLTDDGELQYDDAWRTRVFHNDGGLKFTDVTSSCGVDLKAFGLGGASCDYDADGFPDFYVCCWGANRLYRNRGDGTFEEVAASAGVAGDPDDFSTACAFGDVSGDGVLDLYVANYADQTALIRAWKDGTERRRREWHGIDVFRGPMAMKGQADRLYFGRGDGTFRDVTATHLGDGADEGYGFQPVMSDLDGDGDLDVYVANDISPNYLWINDGHGVFTDRGVETGTAMDGMSVLQASMGVDAADVNRDGLLDLVVTNFSHDHATLYVNDSARARRPSFRDLSATVGLLRPTFDRVAWGVKLLDYDGDGVLDFFASCGHIYPEVDKFPEVGDSYAQRPLLLRGVGPPDWAFEDVGASSGPALQEKRVWRGAAFADFDDDGDLDVFLTALNDKPALLRNDVGRRKSFLVFRLVGDGKLRDPAGARVTVFLADGLPRVEELHHGVSFCGDNDPRLFFGLGHETVARRVEVRWPSGTKHEFRDVAARKSYAVWERNAVLIEDRR